MDLVKELKLENFSEEEKNRILAKFGESLVKRLVLRVYDKLNTSEQEEFDSVVKKGDAMEINEFLSDKIPDFEDIRDEEVKGLVESIQQFAVTK